MNSFTSPSSTESEIGFSESWSDREDDYVAALARQMTQFMFQDDDFEKDFFDKRIIETIPFPEKRINDDLSKDAIRDSDGADFWSFEALVEDQIRDVKKLTEGRNLKRKKKSSLRRKIHSNPTVLNKDVTVLDQGSETKRSIIKCNSTLGTGVFIPKAAAYSSRPTKKSNAPTVIIPARVLHALKFHFDKIGISNSAVSFFEKDGTSGNVIDKQELDLPTEWTY